MVVLPKKILSSAQRNQLTESLTWVRKRVRKNPKLAIILGSGLGSLADKLEDKTAIPTSHIPHYPVLTVEGHKGKIVFGTLAGKNIIAFQGRVHFYETGDLQAVLYPIYIAYGMGARVLLVTNAAGGIKRNFQAGDFMIITDQINLTFENPLSNILHAKPLARNGTLYDAKIQTLIEEIATEQGILIYRGVYCGVKGPSYETAAEVQMVRRLRADAVGMSTVHEVSLASALGMKVGGVSCITNLATGITSQPLSHKEVTEIGKKVRRRFEALVEGIIKGLKM
jgi:purine-nucleoside phosphorylase